MLRQFSDQHARWARGGGGSPNRGARGPGGDGGRAPGSPAWCEPGGVFQRWRTRRGALRV